ncbi:hypothetical protein CEXT_648621 [Caerostris extrusa]|uniref:C2H2-type domain-containing protein n=1 Tax=Caerostris extrusa TaxID=172846 RepID=A0AAV4N962_CAEEX|nr:hypothetical protein CEXT_648621 [Caerostris extrusa]
MCQECGNISLSWKGLRLHRLLVHKEGRMFERTLDAHGRPSTTLRNFPFCHQTTLKAVEDQELERRRPLRFNHGHVKTFYHAYEKTFYPGHVKTFYPGHEKMFYLGHEKTFQPGHETF